MNSLLIAPISPPTPGKDVHGIYQRLGMFIRAFGQVSRHLRILHFVPSDSPTLDVDPETLSDEQSSHWGVAVSVQLVTIASNPKTFRTHYLDGLWSPSHQPDFKPFCGPAQVSAVAQAIAQANEGFDTIFVQGLAGISSLLGRREKLPRLFFDLNDMEHKVRLRSALQPPLRPGKLIYTAQALRLIGMEARAIRLSSATFVCSDVDRRHLQRIGLGKAVHVIPNAIDMPAEDSLMFRNPQTTKNLLFIGDYRYAPNRLAANRMVKRIWPLIRSKCINATLTIAGQGSECLANYAEPPAGVTFPGFVPSLDTLYAGTCLVCCPIMAGGGTRLKLIEAAGYAKPIVSTRVGAEGLNFRHGTEIILCDDDIGFANACISLIEDETLCRRLGQAARVRAQELYDVTAVQRQIANFVT